MTPEGKVTAAIRRFLNPLEKDGSLFVVKIAGGPRQQRGLPDLHLIYFGKAIWLEIKAPGGEATPLQQSVMRRIEAAGGLTAVVRSVDEVRHILECAADN